MGWYLIVAGVVFVGWLICAIKIYKQWQNNVADSTIKPCILTEHEQKLLDDIIKAYPDYIKEIEAKNDKENGEIDKRNGICSHCKSTNVVNKIKRITGQIDGETDMSMESSHFLFAGSSSYRSRGSVHGSMDTEGIKHCRDCGNEEYYESAVGLDNTDRDFLYHITIFFDYCWAEDTADIEIKMAQHLLKEYKYEEFDNVCRYIYENKDKMPNDMKLINIDQDYDDFQIWHNDQDTKIDWGLGVNRLELRGNK